MEHFQLRSSNGVKTKDSFQKYLDFLEEWAEESINQKEAGQAREDEGTIQIV